MQSLSVLCRGRRREAIIVPEPYTPDELKEVRPLLEQLRRHGSAIHDGMGELVLTYNSGVWEQDPADRLLDAIPRLLATIDDQEAELRRHHSDFARWEAMADKGARQIAKAKAWDQLYESASIKLKNEMAVLLGPQT